MTRYAEELAANRRLCILKLLEESRGQANESVLEMGLKLLGHHAGMTRDYVREQLRFLEKASLIRIEYFNDRVMVAHLLGRGADVASGAIDCDGVAQPGFGD